MKLSNLLILILPFLIGCELDEPDANDARVIEAVNLKLTAKTIEVQNDCLQEILTKAEMAVDSAIRSMALGEKLSVFNPPAKPYRPAKPVVPKINDTLEIKPFDRIKTVGDSTGLDTNIIED